MDKVTPNDVLGGMFQSGSFTDVESKRHKTQKSYIGVALRPINTMKFGEYFQKCTGTLNSIVKRADATDRDMYQAVVKDRIGIRKVGRHTSSKNARYSTTDTIYQMLCRKHVDLVCKNRKREIVSDFCSLKEDFIVRFHTIKAMAHKFINDQIMVSDAFIISHRKPTEVASRHGNADMGFITMDTRLINAGDVMISIDDSTSRFGKYDLCVEETHYQQDSGAISFSVLIREARESQDESEIKYDTTKLCSVVVSGHPKNKRQYRPYSSNYILKHFDTQFDGIDIDAMTDYIVEAMETLYNDFDAGLERLREKYHGEFLLSEICDSDDCAI